jgi:predicted transcriptional regulator
MPKPNPIAQADRKKSEVRDYHAQQITEGLAQARAGKLLDYDRVKADWEKRLGR